MRATQAYLLLYNAFQACGWAVSLGCLAYGLLQRDSPEQLYDRAAPFTKFFQGLSLLETLHAAAGLVPSSPLLALMQWAGRSNVLFLILDPITELHASWWAAVLLGAWAAAEVVRYPHYVATTAAAAAGRGGACPGWLTWLRYSAFLPLFPVGVAAEMALMAASLPQLRESERLSLSMPNSLNWAFSYHRFMQVVLVVYPFLWWQLYSSLLRTRAKKLK